MISVTVGIQLTCRCRGAAIPARVCQGRRSAAVFIAAICERRPLSVCTGKSVRTGWACRGRFRSFCCRLDERAGGITAGKCGVESFLLTCQLLCNLLRHDTVGYNKKALVREPTNKRELVHTGSLAKATRRHRKRSTRHCSDSRKRRDTCAC